MLRQRVATAVVLLILLAAVLLSGSKIIVSLALALFFAAACWESLRLFHVQRALLLSLLSVPVLLWSLATQTSVDILNLAAICVLIWSMRFFPALKFGLPTTEGARGHLFTLVFLLTLLGCFISMYVLYQRSVQYLISAMAIVWVADIGAYFVGRAIGKRKLAPTISPGKSWEGALGGWLAVLISGALIVATPSLSDSFPAQLQHSLGWLLWTICMTLIVVASIVGDLFESLLKRRAGVKDSSKLLPGHGGVLDRIDALIPVMPLVVLMSAFI